MSKVMIEVDERIAALFELAKQLRKSRVDLNQNGKTTIDGNDAGDEIEACEQVVGDELLLGGRCPAACSCYKAACLMFQNEVLEPDVDILDHLDGCLEILADFAPPVNPPEVVA